MELLTKSNSLGAEKRYQTDRAKLVSAVSERNALKFFLNASLLIYKHVKPFSGRFRIENGGIMRVGITLFIGFNATFPLKLNALVFEEYTLSKSNAE